jgi:putative transposase
MRDYKNLAHTRWDCKYHIVFIPKKRRKIIFGTLRKHLGGIYPKSGKE